MSLGYDGAMIEPNKIKAPRTKKCSYCGEEFEKKDSMGMRRWLLKAKYCSSQCKTDASRGRFTWNKGLKIDRAKYPNMGHLQKHTAVALEKITEANRVNAKKHGSRYYSELQKKAIAVGLERGSYKGTLGKKKGLCAVWKGDEASYNSKHRWIQKNWQKTGVCQECGAVTKPFGKRKWGTEWHNLDGKYDRENISSWREVCPKCHRKLDKKYGNRYKI